MSTAAAPGASESVQAQFSDAWGWGWAAVPAWPSDALLHWALPLVWAVILALLLGALLNRLSLQRTPAGSDASAVLVKKRCYGLGLVLALIAVHLSGDLSPAYWLGLVFQIPSMSTLILCGGCLLGPWWPHAPAPEKNAVAQAALHRILAGAGVILGWLLLLDTFAVLPFALYAWGLEGSALWMLAVFGVLPYLRYGLAVPGLIALVLPLALAAFVLLRLPTGNVWDAVIDPGLWLWLHWRLMRPAK